MYVRAGKRRTYDLVVPQVANPPTPSLNFFTTPFSQLQNQQTHKGVYNYLLILPRIVLLTYTVKPTYQPNTMPSNTPKPSQTRTSINFLTLPRELRQRILILTFRVPPVVKFDWYTMIARYPSLDPDFVIMKTMQRKRRRMRHWTRTLRKVHSVVAEDMGYVRRQWKKNLDDARTVILV